MIEVDCEDCGGRGVDPGSLFEPEPCQVCLGSGKQLVELDTRSSFYWKRKPMGRVNLPPVVTAAASEIGRAASMIALAKRRVR